MEDFSKSPPLSSEERIRLSEACGQQLEVPVVFSNVQRSLRAAWEKMKQPENTTKLEDGTLVYHHASEPTEG